MIEALKTYITERPLADRFTAFMQKKGLNITDAAKELGCERTTLSKYLSGKVDNLKIEESIRRYLDTQEEADEKPWSRPACLQSGDFLQVVGLCQASQELATIGIVVGRSGRGKTFTLQMFAKLPKVIYIECDVIMSARDLIKAIEEAIGLPRGAGSLEDRANRIREFFRVNRGYLLIIDEADKLMSEYTNKKMDILRSIYDKSCVGLVVSGEPQLESRLNKEMDQFNNRMSFRYELQGLTEQEVREYLAGCEIEDEAVMELVFRATNKRNGCFRLLDRTLDNVLRVMEQRGGTKITMKAVREASQMMVL